MGKIYFLCNAQFLSIKSRCFNTSDDKYRLVNFSHKSVKNFYIDIRTNIFRITMSS